MPDRYDCNDSIARIEGILLAVSHGTLTEGQAIAQILDVEPVAPAKDSIQVPRDFLRWLTDSIVFSSRTVSPERASFVAGGRAALEDVKRHIERYDQEDAAKLTGHPNAH